MNPLLGVFIEHCRGMYSKEFIKSISESLKQSNKKILFGLELNLKPEEYLPVKQEKYIGRKLSIEEILYEEDNKTPEEEEREDIVNRKKQKLLENTAEIIRLKSEQYYPGLKIRGHTLDEFSESEAPVVFGETHPDYFKQIFGDNIKKGLVAQLGPIIPMPSDFYFKWYKTGEFSIPEELRDEVKDIHINNKFAGAGLFAEADLWRPFNSSKYFS